jgi:hypothetical protein
VSGDWDREIVSTRVTRDGRVWAKTRAAGELWIGQVEKRGRFWHALSPTGVWTLHKATTRKQVIDWIKQNPWEA